MPWAPNQTTKHTFVKTPPSWAPDTLSIAPSFPETKHNVNFIDCDAPTLCLVGIWHMMMPCALHSSPGLVHWCAKPHFSPLLLSQGIVPPVPLRPLLDLLVLVSDVLLQPQAEVQIFAVACLQDFHGTLLQDFEVILLQAFGGTLLQSLGGYSPAETEPHPVLGS